MNQKLEGNTEVQTKNVKTLLQSDGKMFVKRMKRMEASYEYVRKESRRKMVTFTWRI